MSTVQPLPLPVHTDVATYVIKVENQAIPQTVQVLSISVDKEINRIPTATLVFRDGDASAESFALSSGNLFVPGAEVEVQLGYRSLEETVFKGIVVKQALRLTGGGTSTLSVECRDKAFRMTLEKKCKYFTEIKDSDVAEEIIGSYALDADFAATSVTHQELVQYATTDWDFLVSRLEANGHICLVSDGKITGAAPNLNQDPAFSITFGSNMLEFDGEIDSRHQATGIIGISWNPTAQEIVESEAAEPGVPETGNLTAAKIAESVGQARRFQHSGKLPADEMQAWTDAGLLRHRLSKVRGRVTFQGLSGITPGQFIDLQGVGERFSGPVFVSGVRHRVSDGSWKTDVQYGICPKPFIEKMNVRSMSASSLIPAVQGLQIGLVTKLAEDPEGEYRIQVRLPVIDPAAEGIWARMNNYDAGNQRGSFFLPEIDDEVLVGFINNDPRDAIVLGMLHSSAHPPPFEASDENHEKGFVSREGLTVRFHDEEKSITIKTPEGNQILLSEDATAVQIDDQNGNQIVLNGDGISIIAAGDLNISASGDVNISGSNVSLDGQQSFAASGGTGAELVSDGTTVIKGSTVMIN